MSIFQKKFIPLIILFLIAFNGHAAFAFFSRPENNLDFSGEKVVYLNDNGLGFSLKTSAKNIGGFLNETGLKLSERDAVIPEKKAALFSGASIVIRRAMKIKIQVDGKTVENWTLQKNIDGVISENSITLGRLDKVSPDLNFFPRADMPIVITRINVEEKMIKEDIDFKIIQNEDKTLSWREKKITQIGEKGLREVKYRITYKNGKEISRIVLEKNTTKNPITQVVTQGTYMKLGKATKGQGTWYSFKGGLFAASTTISRDSYAKVTNTANGKSVVVQINDYGPQGKGRIIDLDKVAFAKIASLGTGVIGVKVEEVLN
jgi:uncharacterized protein YabE (DUF348 family)